MELVSRLVVFAQSHHGIFEGEQDAGFDVEREVEVDRPAASFLWMEVHFPHLTQRIRLHEMPFIVHVESVIHSVVFEVGYVAGDIDGCHRTLIVVGSLPIDPTDGRVGLMDDDQLLAVLRQAAGSVREALDSVTDWGPSGVRPGQYACDLIADKAALGVLLEAGLGVFSEESGSTDAERPLLVVIDPIDGSTNAAHGIPWFSTSMCVLDERGPRVSLVVNQASGVRYEARRGGGAFRDGQRIAPSGCAQLSEAIVGVNGLPERNMGWAQFRALGACSLDLCSVAEGVLDAYATVGGGAVHSWDYLGALLVCSEAGATMTAKGGEDLVIRDDRRRHPIAGATPELASQLLAAVL
jgi:myo-inositol-1(or 4)-monophosphatase